MIIAHSCDWSIQNETAPARHCFPAKVSCAFSGLYYSVSRPISRLLTLRREGCVRCQQSLNIFQIFSKLRKMFRLSSLSIAIKHNALWVIMAFQRLLEQDFRSKTKNSLESRLKLTFTGKISHALWGNLALK